MGPCSSFGFHHTASFFLRPKKVRLSRGFFPRTACIHFIIQNAFFEQALLKMLIFFARPGCILQKKDGAGSCTPTPSFHFLMVLFIPALRTDPAEFDQVVLNKKSISGCSRIQCKIIWQRAVPDPSASHAVKMIMRFGLIVISNVLTEQLQPADPAFVGSISQDSENCRPGCLMDISRQFFCHHGSGWMVVQTKERFTDRIFLVCPSLVVFCHGALR